MSRGSYMVALTIFFMLSQVVISEVLSGTPTPGVLTALGWGGASLYFWMCGGAKP